MMQSETYQTSQGLFPQARDIFDGGYACLDISRRFSISKSETRAGASTSQGRSTVRLADIVDDNN